MKECRGRRSHARKCSQQVNNSKGGGLKDTRQGRPLRSRVKTAFQQGRGFDLWSGS